jgi:hypothetical protein
MSGKGAKVFVHKEKLNKSSPVLTFRVSLVIEANTVDASSMIKQ